MVIQSCCLQAWDWVAKQDGILSFSWGRVMWHKNEQASAIELILQYLGWQKWYIREKSAAKVITIMEIKCQIKRLGGKIRFKYVK
jgi:hypothetical protein